MMASFKLALIQFRVTANKSDNLVRAAHSVMSAAANGAAIVCLPECFNSPYGTQFFARYAETIPSGESYQKLSEMARLSKVWLVGGSIPERCASTGNLFNTSLTFGPDGRQVACFRKLHLFDIDIPGGITFKESESLMAGNKLQLVDTGFCRFGLGICYDIRFSDLAQLYADNGCQLLLYPGAFNMTTGPVHWELLCRARALDNQLYCGVCSPARDPDASYQAWGHSMVVDPWGTVLGNADETEQTVIIDIDLSKLEAIRNQIPVTFQRRLDIYQRPKLLNSTLIEESK